MDISRGVRLGPYEVISPIGAGGMGEVWRAKDTRLDRDVAIKVLPSSLASSPQLRARFEREAKAISSLNHPHICTLHDIGNHSGVDYLVMELIEGESLADRLKKGPLPLDQVLRFGAQIAQALDVAHRHNIIHRDLKPGNVMVTRTGAKLLDFGLAKAAQGSSSGAFIVNADGVSAGGVTEAKPLTQEGTIVGTFHYMAPEQLEGSDTDARTDIFALGCVLYEMATGRRAFDGASRTSLIAAIVSSEPPPISSIAPMTPPALEHVVKRCLEKSSADRWQSAHDVASELLWIGESGSSAAAAMPFTKRRRPLQWAGWLAAVVLAAILAWVQFNHPAPVAPQRVESALLPPAGVLIDAQSGGIALSPDGRKLAFIAHRAGERRSLWIRDAATSPARAVQGTENATLPFWSPDGKSIAFFAAGKLQRVPAEGGSPELVSSMIDSYGGAWSAEGSIVYASGDSIFKVPSAGGTPVKVVRTPGRSPRYPVMLPDGHRFLFTSIGATEPDAVFLASLDGGAPKRVLPGVYSNVVYAAPGLVVYVKESAMRVQRVDPKTIEPVGASFQVADQVQYVADDQIALFTVSATGALAFVAGGGAGLTELAWVGRDGSDLGVITPKAMYYSPQLSHDGKRVVVDLSEGQTAKGDIWMIDLQHGASSRLTYDPANESGPIWSNDDRSVTFFSERLGVRDLYERATNGIGTDQVVLVDKKPKVPLDISPDGRWLAFATGGDGSGRSLEGVAPDVWLFDRQLKKAKPFLTSPFSEHAVQFSPDGKWVAYSSDESGQLEVYVIQFPESSGKWIVSRGGGAQPGWSADGKQLYYLSAAQKLMSVPVTLGASFEAGTPVPLFDAPVRPGYPFRQYCIAKDGSRFLLNRPVREESAGAVTFVQNWVASLPH
jgi:Tol biopolymer transport system component